MNFLELGRKIKDKIIRVEVEPYEDWLEKRKKLVHDVCAAVGAILDDIKEGRYRPTIMDELFEASTRKLDVFSTDTPTRRKEVVVLDRKRIRVDKAA